MIFQEFSVIRPETRTSANEFEIVCVSTIEPRKNHLRLIEAFKQVRQRYDHKKIKLILIGNSYAGRPDYQAQFLAAIADDPSIEWRGNVSDADAAAAIARARFTVYASVVEGFGLPILESLWLGTPCLCHSTGVMNELAKDGGCLTVNMENSGEIADGLERLLNQESLLNRLAREACERPIASWSEYADQIASTVLGLSGSQFGRQLDQDRIAFKKVIDDRAAALSRQLATLNQLETLTQSTAATHVGNEALGSSLGVSIAYLCTRLDKLLAWKQWRNSMRKLIFKSKN